MKQIVSKKTIRNWFNQYQHICEQVNLGNGWKNSCNTGPDIKNARIFYSLYTWIVNQRAENKKITTMSVLEWFDSHNLFLDKTPQYKSNLMYEFRVRFKLVLRKCSHLFKQSIDCTLEVIQAYYQKYAEVIQEVRVHYGIKEGNICNFDQININFDKAGSDITWEEMGTRHVNVNTDEKEYSNRFTLIPCVYSDGSYQLLIIMKGCGDINNKKGKVYQMKDYMAQMKKKYPWVRFWVNEKAWTTENVISYMMNDMLGFTTIEKIMTNKPHKIVILDHAPSHLTTKVEEAMTANNLHPVFIPKGYTHFLQPCDVYLFKVYRALITQEYVATKKMIYEEDREVKKVTEKDMVEIVLKAWMKMDKKIIVQSFKGLLYNVPNDFDYSAEAGNVQRVFKEKLNPKSKAKKAKDVLRNLDKTREDNIDFLLTGEERDEDDEQYPPDHKEDEWEVGDLVNDSARELLEHVEKLEKFCRESNFMPDIIPTEDTTGEPRGSNLRNRLTEWNPNALPKKYSRKEEDGVEKVSQKTRSLVIKKK
eukprot:Mrub_02404.p1 GENE.Mrub_02404~~Mrub_02404.p1  ORF type:complete len:533 (+),score=102.88 Mrub_02404:118-1716(+)